MMKKNYLLLFVAFCCTLSLQAQSKMKYAKNAKTSAIYDKKMVTGLENIKNDVAIPPSAFARGIGADVGVTNYDLQTNATMKPRIVSLGNGKVATAWTYGKGDIAAGVPDRGTGYNTNISGKFLPEPTKRTENIRTGFTNLCIDAEGTEYTFAHTSTAAGGYQMCVNKKAKNATQWTQSLVPVKSVEEGAIWPHAAIAGANGKTIHIAALNCFQDPVTPYNGLEGAMLYWRSLDGGATWDKPIALPGVDTSNYVGMEGDNYAVAAKGDVVAVVYFGGWDDTNAWLSKDNGKTWTKKTIHQFPLKKYVTDTGYDPTTLPADPEAPSEFHIRTSDGAGHVFIDKNNKVHVIFGRMYVSDEETTDGGTTYAPFTDGFYHWEESYTGLNTYDFINAYPDANSNDTIDVENAFGIYYTAITSTPAVAIDNANGYLYMVYSAVDEKTPNDNGDHYRHIFLLVSKDNGKTWSKKPIDLITDKYLDVKNFDPKISECVFPSVAPNIENGKLHLLYQLDDSQGLHVRHPTTQTIDYTDNFSIYVDVDVNAILLKAEEVVTPATFNFEVMPNPAKDFINISYDLPSDATVKMTILDITGRIVSKKDMGNQPIGKNTININLDAVPGIYFAQLNIDGKIATQKIAIQ
jgi:Secretion system C-terminal sorting domain/BNR repeat-like domain